MTLNLIPNPVVGYRIKPDWYCFNVVVVKKHGSGSKSAGQEYETVLAHCKNLEFAAKWLFDHVLRVEGEKLQQSVIEQSVADMQALLQATTVAKSEVLKAVEELRGELSRAGLLTPKQLVQALGQSEDDLSVVDAA